MTDLIKRLEAITKPDRTLDEDVALALGWTQIGPDGWVNPQGEDAAVPYYTMRVDGIQGCIAALRAQEADQ